MFRDIEPMKILLTVGRQSECVRIYHSMGGPLFQFLTSYSPSQKVVNPQIAHCEMLPYLITICNYKIHITA